MNKETIDGVMLRKMLTAARQNLQAQQEVINALNVFPVPDGDTGTNMSLTMEAAIRELGKAQSDELDELMEHAANGSLMGARGNSGVILSQLFRGFSKSVAGKQRLTIQDMALALKCASDTAYKAVMKPTEGTILTVARESAEAAIKLAEQSVELEYFCEQVIRAANESLEGTPELLKVLKDAGVVDSGGKGLVSILEGAYNGLTGKSIVLIEEALPQMNVTSSHEHDESLEYGYCTEFIIHSDASHVDPLREAFETSGDSQLVVGNGNIIKVHIHTNHPGEVMESALKLGYLSDIKIDNMRLQHRHEIFEKAVTETTAATEDPSKPYGMITVAMGEGIAQIFRDFTVDEVIEGGQTMNPSTEDFLKAIEKMNVEHVFILPNNSNIIMAANQAKALSPKPVTVIPSKTVPQGIAAVLAFHPEMSAEENQDLMQEAITDVRTGQVTYAVRDTEMNGLTINKGAMIGLAGKEILAAGKDVQQVSLQLIEKMITEKDEILTVYYGEDIKESMASELEEHLKKQYPELEIEVYFGGQPLYYYLFSLE
ncbi:DAK2 domain-containing protein [Anoxynatronum buryatiense]|uniref:DhaL domain-containing protein n=1 Tax=Anoxynatronum buryatiense TaxID=489973 RepID=A0AA45WUL4_9CLOT|nr:hypothetical protein SAMN06296020_10382 [Anoxynatronum buryatiense]